MNRENMLEAEGAHVEPVAELADMEPVAGPAHMDIEQIDSEDDYDSGCELDADSDTKIENRRMVDSNVFLKSHNFDGRICLTQILYRVLGYTICPCCFYELVVGLNGDNIQQERVETHMTGSVATLMHITLNCSTCKLPLYVCCLPTFCSICNTVET